MRIDRLYPVFCISVVLLIFTFGGPAVAETLLRRGNGAEPALLDPQVINTLSQARIDGDLFEGLIALAPGGRVIPAQAMSWSVSSDGKTWTFNLRPDLKWSNGDKLTAEDFVYSLRRLVDPGNVSRNAFLGRPILHALDIAEGREKDLTKLGVEAPDPRTVRITLAAVRRDFLENLANLFPVHRASIEALGKDAFRPGNLVSNGAYQLAEWRPHVLIAAARNSNYWDTEDVHIDRVEFYPIQDLNEELKRYRAGDLDMTSDVPNGQIDLLRRTLPDEFKQSPSIGNYTIGFNNTRPPFKDNLKLRKALTLAIDRQALADQAARGVAKPAYGWIPHAVAGYPNSSFPGAELSQGERETLAQRLYTEAGYSADHPAEFALLYNTSENHRKIMFAVAAMWKKVLGVEVHVQDENYPSYLAHRLDKRTIEAWRSGFFANSIDPQSLLSVLQSTSELNDMGYENPSFDALFDKATQSTDQVERFRLLGEAEALALADFPAAPIFYYSADRLIKPYVAGWVPSQRDNFRSQDLEILPH
jgi:oligopeptide transport system substrate-binding protein